MVKVNGKNIIMYKAVTTMRVNMLSIKRMVMEYLLGKVEMSIKVIIWRMNEMAKERCIG